MYVSGKIISEAFFQIFNLSHIVIKAKCRYKISKIKNLYVPHKRLVSYKKNIKVHEEKQSFLY